MLRQYAPQRFRFETVGTPLRGRVMPVGTLPAGTVFPAPRDHRHAGSKLIIEAWLPRTYCAARWDAERRTWLDTRLARGGHLAQCRFLGTNRTLILADWLIRNMVDGD